MRGDPFTIDVTDATAEQGPGDEVTIRFESAHGPLVAVMSFKLLQQLQSAIAPLLEPPKVTRTWGTRLGQGQVRQAMPAADSEALPHAQRRTTGN